MTIFRAMLIFALVLPTSMEASAKSQATKIIVQNLPKGWECLQGPNALDHPGTVFYIDKNGVRYEFADLAPEINAHGGEVAAMSAGSNGKISAGLLAKVLSLGGVLSLSFDKSYSVSVALTQRQEFRTDEANTRKALRTLDPSLLADGNKYYVVRNTQVAKQMRLTVDRSISGAFGGDVQFSNALSLSGNAPPAASAPASKPPTAASPAATSTPGPATAPTSSTLPSAVTEAKFGYATTVPNDAASKPSATAPTVTSGSANVNFANGKPPSVSGTIAIGAPAKASTATAGSTPSSPETASALPAAAAPQATSNKSPAIISSQDARTFTIDQTFNQPLTVCFLAQKFELANITGGVGGSVRQAKLEDEYWTPSSDPR